MMLHIPALLAPDQVRQCRQALEQAPWVDGRATAGHQAARVKENLQLAPEHPATQQIGNLILDALGRNSRFMAAALPLKVLPPRFNRYEGGAHYGAHVDSSVLSVPGTPHRIRSDISATLFFSDPAEYDGGELTVQDRYGAHTAKLPAGHLVIYPGSSLHHVTPVTRGTRYAAFFWIQSLVREDHQRTLLLDLDDAIQGLTASHPDHASLPPLMGVYHNLLRTWSET